MSNKRIVFVLNSVTITRCQKRVQEFIDNGYEVDVYGFTRGDKVYSFPAGFTITPIGNHPISMGYLKRLFVIAKSLKKLHKKYKDQKDVLFFYFFFDVAFAASMVSRREFIYEESDMPYTNMSSGLLRKLLSLYDRKLIKKSLLTTMTSEGFIDYHGLENNRDNIVVVPNRVNPGLLKLNYKHKVFEEGRLSIGFVGGFRYQSIYNFTKQIVTKYHYITFHVYGNIISFKDELQVLSKHYPNLILHGTFKNPDDLPAVYESLDLVLATYDADSINAQYAEPNKMYESIFFRVPIIVSKGTFLSRKVERLGIGYSVDALDDADIEKLILSITESSVQEKIDNLSKIPLEEAINDNPLLFEYLKKKNIR